VALSLGMDHPVTIETPLMWLDKAATWHWRTSSAAMRWLQLIREETNSCYLGERSKLFEWGRGCGLCPACGLRARAGRPGRRAARRPADDPHRGPAASGPHLRGTCASEQAPGALSRKPYGVLHQGRAPLTTATAPMKIGPDLTAPRAGSPPAPAGPTLQTENFDREGIP